MLLCLTDGAEISPVYEYCQQINLHYDIIDLTEYTDLKTAVAKNRAIANYDFVLFYFTVGSSLHRSELLETVTHIRRFYHARIIVFAPNNPETVQLFGELIDMGLRELVVIMDDTDIASELEECLSMDGKSFAEITQIQFAARTEKARSYIRPEFVIPDDLRLTIGVAGSQPRTGVTTQAFSMYHALAFLGFSPCIVDVNQSFIESLLMLYEDEAERKGSVITIQGMDFSPDIQVGTGHNIFIYDLGELDDNNAGIFRVCDLRILCAGTKPWELPVFAAKENVYGQDIDMMLFSFASEREQNIIDELGLAYTVAYVPWNPDIWEHTNKEWHEQLLIPFLKERLAP